MADDLVMYQPRKFALRVANGSQIMFIDAVPGDQDADGIEDYMDNCPEAFNPDQIDTDQEAFGDVCDSYPNDPDNFAAWLIETKMQHDLIDFIDYLNSMNDQLQSDLYSCQDQRQAPEGTINQLQSANTRLMSEDQ